MKKNALPSATDTVEVEALTVGTHMEQPFTVGSRITVTKAAAEHLVQFGIARLVEQNVAPVEPAGDATPTV